MAQLPLTTYQDLLDHVIDFLGANVSNEADRDARRAIQSALRIFSNAHRWSFFYQRGRIITVPMFGTSNTPSPPPGTPTIQYTNATQQVVVSNAAWPSWILQGVVLLNNIEYSPIAQIDSYTIQLDPSNNPGADIAAGTLFMAYQDTYSLPADFISVDQIINATYVMGLDFVHPSQWLEKHRIVYTPATPYRYTITGHPNYFGLMALRLFPAPDVAYQLDFIYQRRSRPLGLDNYSVGSATVSTGNQIIQGNGTTWTTSMVGSVIRFSADGISYPTGVVGSNPYVYERVISAVSGPTSITLDSTIPANLTNVKYLISDPVDLEEGSMMTAFLRCCEWQVSRSRNMRDRGELEREYQSALTRARETDSRSFQERAAGVMPADRLRLAYMPRGPDMG